MIDINNLTIRKNEINQQLFELECLLDGLNSPAVAEKVANLEIQKAELTDKLNRLTFEVDHTKTELSSVTEQILNCSGSAAKQIVDAISNKRIFNFKNKPKLIFDSHTGCLFPNKELFPNSLKFYESRNLPVTYPKELANFLIADIDGYKNFNLPNNKNIAFYDRSIRAVIGEKIYIYLATDSSCDGSKDITNHFAGPNRSDSFVQAGKRAVAFPFSIQLASEDFFPDSPKFTKIDHTQKILSIFFQEGWIPKFDDEEITKLYERMYVTRPALIQALVKIQEKLAELPPPKQGFADGIDFAELIKGYDLESIRGSLVRYHAELVRWFSELLISLDDFSREQEPLLAEAQDLINNLRDTIDEDDGQDEGKKILTERAKYLSQHLDFGLESLQAELVAFKSEAMASRDTLASARTLADLRQIEKHERPDFYLVAEHSAELIKQRLQGVDWFREHKELATTLIELHQEWRNDLHKFEHTTCTHFMEKCAGESIDAEKSAEWFTEWRRERLLAEEHLLPLMRAGGERIIPVEIVIGAVDLLKSSIRDELGGFFYDKRIALHQKFAFKPGGDLQEHFEKESALAAINSEFQKRLEELIFKIDGTEGRLLLVRWAKDWYDSLVGDLLAFVDKDEYHKRIAHETLDGFRAIKRHTLEAFLQDVKAYAVAREEKDKEWNSLLFRMRSDLAKKAVKGK